MGNQGNANILGSPLLETAFYEYLQRLTMEGTKSVSSDHVDLQVPCLGSVRHLRKCKLVVTTPAERRRHEAEWKLAFVEAENLERERKFIAASKRFSQAIALLLGVGPNAKIPIDATNGGVRSPMYLKLTMDDCLAAMTCANGVARCLYETGQLIEVCGDSS